MKKFYFILIVIFSATSIFAQYTLRVASYNLLRYDGGSRNSYFESILNEINPAVLVVQEMMTGEAADEFQSEVLNGNLTSPDFHDGYDMDSQLYYNPFEIKFHSSSYISTSLRDIAEYKLEIASQDQIFFLYSMHLKASSGSDNEQKRLAETEILREHLNQHPAGTHIIVAGDYNIYKSMEPAYIKLTGSEADNDGRLYDPLDQAGSWHNNTNYAGIHTQSTRLNNPGSGAGGGMDDRFDQILISESLISVVQPETYTAYGNDGNHFNIAINTGTNSAVSSTIATALHNASDHLPVFVDFRFGTTSIDQPESEMLAKNYRLHQNYPNPFNPSTTISYFLPESADLRIQIYNIQGELVRTLVNGNRNAGEHSLEFKAGNLPSGLYYYELRTKNHLDRKKMLLLN